ncbi:MAG: hypothetical protein MRERC_1c237 [Mycoplasmataceae bacterium RC_NB112A]|nr:MAG: hypothetical protein MRERC_1c237 [Mycoplasmataceae bacterium RC_NB112A]
MKAVDDGKNYYWEIKRYLRRGINEENYGLDYSYRKCLNCGKSEELLDYKNWLCPKCHCKSRSKKDKH